MTKRRQERLDAMHPIPAEAAQSSSVWVMILIGLVLAVLGCLIAGGLVPNVSL
jgi:hypothetical protein